MRNAKGWLQKRHASGAKRKLLALMGWLVLVTQSMGQDPPDRVRIEAFQKQPVEATSQEFVQCLEVKGAKPYDHELLRKYGIIVLNLRQGDKSTALSMLESCSTKGSEWLEVPIEVDRGTYQVPTNEIIVKFKSTLPKGRIEKLERTYRLTIVQGATTRNPTRYTLSLDGAAAPKARSVAATLAKLPEVEYAEVNSVVVTSPKQVYLPKSNYCL